MARKIYNKIPKLWKEQNNNVFKNKLNKFLADKAYYDVEEFLNDIIIDNWFTAQHRLPNYKCQESA